MLGVDEEDELIDHVAESKVPYGEKRDFGEIILEYLEMAGVQQAHKEDKIVFSSHTGWPGDYICAEERYTEGNKESGAQKKAGIFIGPEFGTVARSDLVAAAREAADAGCDVLIAYVALLVLLRCATARAHHPHDVIDAFAINPAYPAGPTMMGASAGSSLSIRSSASWSTAMTCNRSDLPGNDVAWGRLPLLLRQYASYCCADP